MDNDDDDDDDDVNDDDLYNADDADDGYWDDDPYAEEAKYYDDYGDGLYGDDDDEALADRITQEFFEWHGPLNDDGGYDESALEEFMQRTLTAGM